MRKAYENTGKKKHPLMRILGIVVAMVGAFVALPKVLEKFSKGKGEAPAEESPKADAPEE